MVHLRRYSWYSAERGESEARGSEENPENGVLCTVDKDAVLYN